MPLILIGTLLALLALFAATRLGAFTGKAPSDLGVRDGKLKAPSATPNSVSTQAALWPDHPQHAYAEIAPLKLQGDAVATLARVAQWIDATAGARIVERKPDYLYAQFTTPLMRFVDDAEFWFDPAANVIQLRSASRLGQGDLGANRARIERLRAALGAS
ncbi:MAG: DUF1499 domain-containing protein [Burkholderiaceae bacterium]